MSVLVLAGLDPSGAAGLLADAEAIAACGERALCVPTALTVQTTRGARRFEPVRAALVLEMAAALLEEEEVRAVKIGMVASAESAAAVAALLRGCEVPVVVDPVLRASSGAPLFEGDGPAAYLALARGAVLTPNVPEAEALGGADAQALRERSGARAVLLKGGHLPGEPVDVLADARGAERFGGTRIASTARGTGCRLAAALAARLAQGASLREAVVDARAVVRRHLSMHPLQR